MPKLPRRRPRGCAYCWSLPGETRPAEPEPGCTACAAREWAPLPYADLGREEWDYITALLDLRSGGRCEGCGLPFVPGVREASRHHRRPHRMGGTDDAAINGLANLLLLCGGQLAGVVGCHGRVEAQREDSIRRGLLVASGSYLPGPGVEPPEITQVVHLQVREGVYRRVLLDPINPTYLDAPGDRWAA